ncbi:Hpt domain-containing protein [Pyruvatibacter sp.]|uniref:Hpt domain-containing protein n=1 Tax=Pyruvatibacter sp. TaxID=1981328 RepID=UPI003267E3D4
MIADPDSQTALAEDDLELDDDLLAAIAAAEAAVGEMAEDYPSMLIQDADLLKAAIARLRLHAPGTDEHAAACVDTFGVLHDIKGQAASFGYEAATALCDPLCECVRGKRTVDPQMMDHLEAAVELLNQMAAHGVSPDSDEAAHALIKQLPAA